MWRCWNEIDFPEDGWPAQTRRSYAGGTDAMDAIQIGLMKLGTDLHFTSYHKEHKLYEGQEGSYGLIVPKNARDLLAVKTLPTTATKAKGPGSLPGLGSVVHLERRITPRRSYAPAPPVTIAPRCW